MWRKGENSHLHNLLGSEEFLQYRSHVRLTHNIENEDTSADIAELEERHSPGLTQIDPFTVQADDLSGGDHLIHDGPTFPHIRNDARLIHNGILERVQIRLRGCGIAQAHNVQHILRIHNLLRLQIIISGYVLIQGLHHN